jgi:hypothetical protein
MRALEDFGNVLILKNEAYRKVENIDISYSLIVFSIII